MMRRIFLVTLGLSVVALVTALHAQEGSQSSPQPAPPDISKTKDKITLEEKKLAEKFNVFIQQLSQLKEKLEKGTPADRQIAKVLDEVIKRNRDKSIDVQFQELVAFLKTDNLKNLGSIQEALSKSEKITKDLQELLVLLRQEKSLEDLQAERLKLEKLAKELEDIIRKEKFNQAQTQDSIANPTDPKGLQDAEKENADSTAKVIKKLDGKDGDDGKGGGGEGEIAKSASKSGAKGEGQKADGKGEAKAGDGKGEGQGKKGGPGEEGGQGQAKGGEGKEGDKPGAGEKGQPGQGKDSGKDGMKDGQGGAKGGEGKPGEGEPGGAKGGEGKEPGEGQPGGAKGGEGQPSDAKGGGEGGMGGEGDAKGGEGGMGGEGGAKGGGEKGKDEPKQPNEDKGNNKAEAKKPSKGDQGKAKAGDKGDQGGSKSAGSPKGGDDQKGGEGGSKGGAKGGGQPGEPGGGGGGGKGGDEGGGDDQQAEIKKKIQDAEHYQRIAEKEIAKAPEKAVGNQEEAIKKLKQAKKELEDILRQMREEEIERLLAALQVRCEHMLLMQIAVRDATVSIGESVAKNNNKQSELHKKQSLDQSNKEKEIIEEATKAIDMLEAEGTAVAFPEVFRQVREDMKLVANRLENADVGNVTVAIENDIIKTLEEMVAALKKARDDNKKKKDSPPGEGKPGQPGDQKLMELIAELKLVRSMQVKVNDRTNLYGQQYKGEQASNPEIQKQLQDLGNRQEKLFDVTNRLAKGDNK